MLTPDYSAIDFEKLRNYTYPDLAQGINWVKFQDYILTNGQLEDKMLKKYAREELKV